MRAYRGGRKVLFSAFGVGLMEVGWGRLWGKEKRRKRKKF
jgi:hypothetical protein